MTGEVSYVLMDPTGNMTVLVETPVPGSCYHKIAAELMRLEPMAEQTGFLTFTQADVKMGGLCITEGFDAELKMAGGEFCGNATMSSAVRCAMKKGLDEDSMMIKVSGVQEPVTASVKHLESGKWEGKVGMPACRNIQSVTFPDGQTWPVVSFDGISHVIVEEFLPEWEAENLIKKWCYYLKADALGMMFFDCEKAELTPLVYVPAVDTLFWESACGSGTTAVGAYLSQNEDRDIMITLKQPGGSLTVTAQRNGSLYLKGIVRYLYSRKVLLDY